MGHKEWGGIRMPRASFHRTRADRYGLQERQSKPVIYIPSGVGTSITLAFENRRHLLDFATALIRETRPVSGEIDALREWVVLILADTVVPD